MTDVRFEREPVACHTVADAAVGDHEREEGQGVKLLEH
jgi:hypothetical protein